jgi:hypothetical protein
VWITVTNVRSFARKSQSSDESGDVTIGLNRSDLMRGVSRAAAMRECPRREGMEKGRGERGSETASDVDERSNERSNVRSFVRTFVGRGGGWGSEPTLVPPIAKLAAKHVATSFLVTNYLAATFLVGSRARRWRTCAVFKAFVRTFVRTFMCWWRQSLWSMGSAPRFHISTGSHIGSLYISGVSI